MSIPTPPADLGPRGKKFWRAVASAHEMRADDIELLSEAARMLDLLDALRKAMGKSGPIVRDGHGNPTAHPALVEMRHVRQGLRHTLRALGLVDEPDDDAEAPRRRRQS